MKGIYIFSLTSFVLFLRALCFAIIFPALPAITSQLHFPEYAGRFFVLFILLGAALSQFYVSVFVGARKAKRYFLIACLFLFLGGAINVFLPVLWALWLGEFFQGIGFGMSYVLVIALIGRVFEAEGKTVKYLAYSHYFAMLALIFGSLFSGLIAQYASWRILYVIVAVFALIQAILGCFISMPRALPNYTVSEKLVLIKQFFLDKRFYLWVVPFLFIVGLVFLHGPVLAYILAGDFHQSSSMIGVWFVVLNVFSIYGQSMSVPLYDTFDKHLLVRVIFVLFLVSGILFLVFYQCFSILSLIFPVALFLLLSNMISPIVKARLSFMVKELRVTGVAINLGVRNLFGALLVLLTGCLSDFSYYAFSVFVFFMLLAALVMFFLLGYYLLQTGTKKPGISQALLEK